MGSLYPAPSRCTNNCAPPLGSLCPGLHTEQQRPALADYAERQGATG